MKLINRLPRDWLVNMYKIMPFKGIRNWIVYRAQHKFLVAVLGIITNEQGQILLLHHDYRKSKPWGIPGGWMEGEKPEEGLLREIAEETGLEVVLTGLAQAIYNKKPDRVDLIFTGKVVGGVFQSCSEISAMMYCDIDQWPDGMPEQQKLLIKNVLQGKGE